MSNSTTDSTFSLVLQIYETGIVAVASLLFVVTIVCAAFVIHFRKSLYNILWVSRFVFTIFISIYALSIIIGVDRFWKWTLEPMLQPLSTNELDLIFGTMCRVHTVSILGFCYPAIIAVVLTVLFHHLPVKYKKNQHKFNPLIPHSSDTGPQIQRVRGYSRYTLRANAVTAISERDHSDSDDDSDNDSDSSDNEEPKTNSNIGANTTTPTNDSISVVSPNDIVLEDATVTATTTSTTAAAATNTSSTTTPLLRKTSATATATVTQSPTPNSSAANISALTKAGSASSSSTLFSVKEAARRLANTKVLVKAVVAVLIVAVLEFAALVIDLVVVHEIMSTSSPTPVYKLYDNQIQKCHVSIISITPTTVFAIVALILYNIANSRIRGKVINNAMSMRLLKLQILTSVFVTLSIVARVVMIVFSWSSVLTQWEALAQDISFTSDIILCIILLWGYVAKPIRDAAAAMRLKTRLSKLPPPDYGAYSSYSIKRPLLAPSAASDETKREIDSLSV